MKDKILKLTNNENYILSLLCFFIVIQPFLDILPLYENENLTILGFTIPTMIRCAFIGLMGIISLKYIDKKQYKYIIIYFIILLIYTIIHHKIASDNDIIIPNNYSYSITQELFYIIRMLLPLGVINFTKNSNISQETFLKVITISSAIIGTIIFIGNTLCISYVSYGTGQTTINWIQWFFNDLKQFEFAELTSKGWFYMANQVSGITILLLPFTLFAAIKKRTKLNIYAAIILIISMIMIGTRIAAYGWLILIVCLLIVITLSKYLYKDQRTKSNFYQTLLLIVIIGTIFLLNSPINNREYGYKLGDLTTLKERPEINSDNQEKVYQYIEESYKVFKIQDIYIFKIYNYKNDPEFWYQIFDRSIKSGVIENREMQRLISNRIIEKNNNIKYQLFGYSFSRMRNGGTYIEHDVLVQMFTLGYIGTLLLIGPYILITGIICIRVIKKLKRKIALFNITFLLSIAATFLAAILTGHILDELFVTIYLGFILGCFLQKIEKKKEKKS